MKRIFIVSQYPMFGRGLKNLLCQQPDLDIIGWETNLEQAVVQIEQLQPEVILLESDHSFPGVSAILHVSPHSKVVNLSLQSNQLLVYQVRQRIVKTVEDLLKIITKGLD